MRRPAAGPLAFRAQRELGAGCTVYRHLHCGREPAPQRQPSQLGTPSEVTSVFGGLAEGLASDADDLLLLEADGISTCGELFCRLPNAERLEEYLGQRVYGFRAERGGMTTG